MLSPCLHPGCAELVAGWGRCEQHRGEARGQRPRQPGTRPWDRAAWTREAAAAVRAAGRCALCGRTPDHDHVQLVCHHVNFDPTRSGVVDPTSPLQVLCSSCHQRLHRRAEHAVRKAARAS
jgi:hypothetical protein